ncbi:MAG: hypothetical protein OEY56_11135 [Cyclobacteriaceae bacterium]|nr:hypothetical protein [Cyclobacteriaceae bacterium]
MNRNIIGIAFFFLALLSANGQNDAFKTWKILSKIDYEKSQDEYGEIYVPKFSPEIQSLRGKTITLPGYIIPFEGMFKPEHIIISSLPIASCFFCGSGGPETVAEAYLKSPVKYSAKMVNVTGTLELNDKDTNQLMYILKNATLSYD